MTPSARASVQVASTGGGISSPYPPGGVWATGMALVGTTDSVVAADPSVIVGSWKEPVAAVATSRGSSGWLAPANRMYWQYCCQQFGGVQLRRLPRALRNANGRMSSRKTGRTDQAGKER